MGKLVSLGRGGPYACKRGRGCVCVCACARLSLPARACARARGAGCVCPRRVGALWVRQCLRRVTGGAGRGAPAPFPLPALRSGGEGRGDRGGEERRGGNSRLASLAGLFRVFLVGANSLDFAGVLVIVSAVWFQPKGSSS